MLIMLQFCILCIHAMVFQDREKSTWIFFHLRAGKFKILENVCMVIVLVEGYFYYQYKLQIQPDVHSWLKYFAF